MNRIKRCGVFAKADRIALVATAGLWCGVGPVAAAVASDADATSPTQDNTAVWMFNLEPTASYSVNKNSAPLTTVNSSQAGAAVYLDATAPGDRYEVALAGAGPQAPSAPTGVVASGDDAGCAFVQWSANPEADIDYYRVYRGETSGSYIDSLDVAGKTDVTECGLSDGDYYFAVRAHNTAGLLSALSLEVSASVSNGSTQPPLPPAVVEASEGNAGCMDVSWTASGSAGVVGYVIDYGTQSVAGGEATTYQHTLEVGDVTSHHICGLDGGTYYVAVRSKNFADMMSPYSGEETVDVAPTAVFITAFRADCVPGAVNLTWEIWTDETLRGLELYRQEGDRDGWVALNAGRALRASQSQWRDSDVEPATTYRYVLAVIGEDGVEHRSPPESVTTGAWSMSLEQNVPNPFNPSTSLSFIVPETSRAVLVVFDVRGVLVRRLVDEVVPAGRRTVSWDGTNDDGQAVASGTYFYRLTVGKRSVARKMQLLK